MISEMRLIIGTNIQWEIYNLYTGERKADSIDESAFLLLKKIFVWFWDRLLYNWMDKKC